MNYVPVEERYFVAYELYLKNKGKHPYKNGGYKHSGLLKKNRKIKLKQYPVCQVCKINKADTTHHLDKSRDNHSLDNLVAFVVIVIRKHSILVKALKIRDIINYLVIMRKSY